MCHSSHNLFFQLLESIMPSPTLTTPNAARTCSAVRAFGRWKMYVQLRRSGCWVQLISTKFFPVSFVGKGRAMAKNVNITKREHVPHKISALMLCIVMRTNFTRQKRSVKGKTDSAAWSRSSKGMPNAWEELRIFRLLAMNVAFNTGRGQKELMH